MLASYANFWGCVLDNTAQIVLKARVLYSCKRGVGGEIWKVLEAILLSKVVMVHGFENI